MTFQSGKSGNPNGRPKGALNKRTQLAKLLESHATELINKTIELALNGDSAMLRVCIERLIAKAQHHPIDIDFPLEINDENKTQLKKSILFAAAQGQMSISDAEKLITLTDKHIPHIKSDNEYNLDTMDAVEASRIYQQIMTAKYK